MEVSSDIYAKQQYGVVYSLIFSDYHMIGNYQYRCPQNHKQPQSPSAQKKKKEKMKYYMYTLNFL